jgi:hypothetical protein
METVPRGTVYRTIMATVPRGTVASLCTEPGSETLGAGDSLLQRRLQRTVPRGTSTEKHPYNTLRGSFS